MNGCACTLSGKWLWQLSAAKKRCGDGIVDENAEQQIKKRKLEKQQDQLASSELGPMPDGTDKTMLAKWFEKAVNKKQLIHFELRSADDKLYNCWTPKNGWNTVGKEWFESKDKLHKANFVWIGKIIPDSDKEAEEKKFQAKHDKKARMLSAYCRPKPKGKGKAPAK